METQSHQHLKRMALGFLFDNGCQAAAMEVSCPFSRYRIDVAGYTDRILDAESPPRRCEPRTVVIECKQSRQDFLRDSEHSQELIELRARLDVIRQSIEEHRIKQLEPQLRCDGSSLFTELDEWDFSRSRLRSYREIMRKLRRIDEKLHGQTKFFLMARYRLADQLFIAAPRGMIRRGELPPGWGLLECPRGRPKAHRSGEPPMLRISVPPSERASKPVYRTRLLRNIAVAASNQLARLHQGHRSEADAGPQLFSTISKSPTFTT